MSRERQFAEIDSSQKRTEVGIDPETSGPCVYFVFAQGLVKIGRTVNLRERLRKMKNDEFPHGTKNFGSIEETLFIRTDHPTRLEKLLHKLMAPERVTGEWFHIKDKDIAAIKDLFESSIGNFPNLHESLAPEIETEIDYQKHEGTHWSA